MLNRKIIFDQLTALLDKKVTAEAMYGWALGIVVTEEYEKISQEDPLIHTVLEDLMNVAQASEKRRPSEELLDYYRRCLSGQDDYDAKSASTLSNKAYARLKGSEPEPSSFAGLNRGIKKSYKKSKRGFLLFLRGYVYFFALCIIAIHFASMLSPEIVDYDGTGNTNRYIMTEAIPHVTYAFILLVPFHWLVRNQWLFFSLPAMIFGAFYYWRVSLELIVKLSLHQFFILVILPFGAIPATVALVLLLIEWKRTRRRM
ncbi:MAG TPA: hypothetical protein PLT76_08210 [Candidatus Omnitrophota bacterium]|nr:hypothetical protein [Candidatus Omnitrophota bacterium]HQO58683.1 hypothetical protein [Candidatus Omnitrophota bacterium]